MIVSFHIDLSVFWSGRLAVVYFVCNISFGASVRFVFCFQIASGLEFGLNESYEVFCLFFVCGGFLYSGYLAL